MSLITFCMLIMLHLPILTIQRRHVGVYSSEVSDDALTAEESDEA